MLVNTTESEIMQLFVLANSEHKYVNFTFNIHLNWTQRYTKVLDLNKLESNTLKRLLETFMYLHRSTANP